MDNRFVIYQLPEGGYQYLPPGGETAFASDIAEVLEHSGGAEIALVIPGENVLLADVNLPPVRQASKRLLAARFALEDQIIQPVDTQHFAIGSSDGRGRTPVSVADREYLEQSLTVFGAERDRVVSIVPDMLCLPLAERDAWTVWAGEQRALVRTGISSGFVAEPESLPTLLASREDEDTPPLLLYIEDRNRQASLLETLHARGLDFETHDQPANLLQCWSGRPLLNLATGAFAGGQRKVAWWAPLKATAALLALWVGLMLGTQIIEYQHLQKRIVALDAQAEETFREAFPNVQDINDIRYQAEEEIRRLRGEGSTGGLFPLLQATAGGASAEGKLKMQSLQFRDGRLSLSLLGEDLKALETLRGNFARQRDASLDVEDVDADNDGVRIRATVTEAGV